MLYREIIAVCSESHTKHINTAVWAERGLFNVTVAVRKVTRGLPVGIICDVIDADDGVMVSIGVTNDKQGKEKGEGVC